MKKALIAFLLIFFSLNKANAQKDVFALHGGITSEGYAAMLSYDAYHYRDYIEVSLLLTSSIHKYKDYKLPYQSFSLNFGYSKNIYESVRSTQIVNISAGANIGFENINNGEIVLENGATISNKSSLIYGLYVGIEPEFYINDYISLTLKVNEYYNIKSSLGNFTPFIGVGIKYFLN